MAGRHSQSDDRPERVADDDRRLFEQRGDAIGVRVEPLCGARQGRRSSVARKLRHDQAAVLGKCGCDERPVGGGAAETVQQGHFRAASGFEPAEAGSADFR
jgi:hypothetical protein